MKLLSFAMMTKTAMTKFLVILGLGLSLTACGGSDSDSKASMSKTTALGVNGYLWQASLEVLDFMSFEAIDARSGAIVSEWYTDPNEKTERVKVTVRFLSQQLRSDGIRVTVVRQKNEAGTYVTLPVKAVTGIKIQNSILDYARTLRQAAG